MLCNQYVVELHIPAIYHCSRNFDPNGDYLAHNGFKEIVVVYLRCVILFNEFFEIGQLEVELASTIWWYVVADCAPIPPPFGKDTLTEIIRSIDIEIWKISQ